MIGRSVARRRSSINGFFKVEFFLDNCWLELLVVIFCLLFYLFIFYSLDIVSLKVVFYADVAPIFVPKYFLSFIEWFETNTNYFRPTSSFFVASFGLYFIFLKPRPYLWFYCSFWWLYFLFFCFLRNYSNFFYPE